MDVRNMSFCSQPIYIEDNEERRFLQFERFVCQNQYLLSSVILLNNYMANISHYNLSIFFNAIVVFSLEEYLKEVTLTFSYDVINLNKLSLQAIFFHKRKNDLLLCDLLCHHCLNIQLMERFRILFDGQKSDVGRFDRLKHEVRIH